MAPVFFKAEGFRILKNKIGIF